MLLFANLRTRVILPSAACCALAIAACFGAARPASAGGATTLVIDVQIARDGGKPVVDAAFIAERVARANEIFAPYAVRFVQGATLPLDASRAALETAADRDALGASVRASVINCFVVRSLRDVDDPAQMRRGVHWHSRAYPGAHYVILSAIGGPAVLAHELGHFLGNPKHSEVAGNLMSYQHTDALPFLDALQQRRMARTLRGYLRSGELKARRSSPAAEQQASAD
jgi:hypothetical protein